MLNEKYFKDTKYKQMIIESEKKRFKDVSFIDEIYELREKIVKAKFDFDNSRKKINQIQKMIKDLFKTKTSNVQEEKDQRIREKADEEANCTNIETSIKDMEERFYQLIYKIGNILDDDVPLAETDEGNVVVKTHGTVDHYPEDIKSYDILMDPYTNLVAGSRVSGSKGYFLQGKMAILGRALKNYAFDFLIDREYEPIQTPLMVTKEIMKKTCQLSDFEEQLYETLDNKYLIATSEQPLTALFDKQELNEHNLPKVFAGESHCFRREAGKVNSGLFRVHEFEKIEQFVFCLPDQSKDFHEKLLKTSEEFLQSLGLSYRIVLIASGDMNDSAAKKYDIEAYFPCDKTYKELVSASNCTDYQSRSLNVRYGFSGENEEGKYVHMLNATLCAVQRTLCCVVENFQRDGKVIVPEVLRPYTRFDSFELKE